MRVEDIRVEIWIKNGIDDKLKRNISRIFKGAYRQSQKLIRGA
jgi:hypothetical protein